jgi:lycopene beta-cyclase
MFGAAIYPNWWVCRAFHVTRFNIAYTMTKLWDIVVVGGGLGGLTLATELAAADFSRLAVLVLEKREYYVRDRTWSYWRDRPHRYSHLERQRWSRWSVGLEGVNHSQSSAHYVYATLDADRFYAEALQTLHGAAHIELRNGCAVTSINAQQPLKTVQLDNGETIHARLVLDARPAATSSPTTLVQQFVGWQISTNHPIFDSSSVQLMAFEPHANGLHFWYVLPYSAHCALVENTWISPASWQPNFHQELQHHVSKLCGATEYSIDYQERGVLGLQDIPMAMGLGRNAGTLRPATGYAFLDTLQHSQKIAKSLAVQLAQGSPTLVTQNFARSKKDLWMDGIFLQALSQDWASAPSYFMQLFSANSADDTVAFLTGSANMRQRFRMMRSLPIAPFSTAAVRSVIG